MHIIENKLLCFCCKLKSPSHILFCKYRTSDNLCQIIVKYFFYVKFRADSRIFYWYCTYINMITNSINFFGKDHVMYIPGAEGVVASLLRRKDRCDRLLSQGITSDHPCFGSAISSWSLTPKLISIVGQRSVKGTVQWDFRSPVFSSIKPTLGVIFWFRCDRLMKKIVGQKSRRTVPLCYICLLQVRFS